MYACMDVRMMTYVYVMYDIYLKTISYPGPCADKSPGPYINVYQYVLKVNLSI